MSRKNKLNDIDVKNFKKQSVKEMVGINIIAGDLGNR